MFGNSRDILLLCSFCWIGVTQQQEMQGLDHTEKLGCTAGGSAAVLATESFSLLKIRRASNTGHPLEKEICFYDRKWWLISLLAFFKVAVTMCCDGPDPLDESQMSSVCSCWILGYCRDVGGSCLLSLGLYQEWPTWSQKSWAFARYKTSGIIKSLWVRNTQLSHFGWPQNPVLSFSKVAFITRTVFFNKCLFFCVANIISNQMWAFENTKKKIISANLAQTCPPCGFELWVYSWHSEKVFVSNSCSGTVWEKDCVFLKELLQQKPDTSLSHIPDIFHSKAVIL